MGAWKDEFPPLLAPGLHKMTVDALRRLTVADFPLSQNRGNLWKSFEFILKALSDAEIPCGIWVDGSFLTKKIDPGDVDFVVDIPIEVMDAATPEQMTLIENLSARLYKKSDNLHSFVMFTTPVGHAMHADMTRVHLQWEKDFGFAYVSKEPKGIALVEVTP
jgi:hypothetical protein